MNKHASMVIELDGNRKPFEKSGDTMKRSSAFVRAFNFRAFNFRVFKISAIQVPRNAISA